MEEVVVMSEPAAEIRFSIVHNPESWDMSDGVTVMSYEEFLEMVMNATDGELVRIE